MSTCTMEICIDNLDSCEPHLETFQDIVTTIWRVQPTFLVLSQSSCEENTGW